MRCSLADAYAIAFTALLIADCTLSSLSAGCTGVHNAPTEDHAEFVNELGGRSEMSAYLEKAGVRLAPGGIRAGASGFDVCFVHPKSAEGVLRELVQAPADVIKALGGGK